MITKSKIFDMFSNSLNQFLKEMYGDQSGEFVCGSRGLKGYVTLFSFRIIVQAVKRRLQIN